MLVTPPVFHLKLASFWSRLEPSWLIRSVMNFFKNKLNITTAD